MKQTKIIMGMPIRIEILDDKVTQKIFKKVFTYFRSIDKQFSPFERNSEVSKIQREEVKEGGYSKHMQEVLALAEKTKQETDGYFDVSHRGIFDPSGIVKGWAIYHASKLIEEAGFKNFYIDAGGDIQANGVNKEELKWRVGIRNPFNPEEIVKVVFIQNEGMATSGTYFRGQHVYNPFSGLPLEEAMSISVIGPNVLEADRFATAAFAMGRRGIAFIENLQGFEGYMIDKDGMATYTSGFKQYCHSERSRGISHH